MISLKNKIVISSVSTLLIICCKPCGIIIKEDTAVKTSIDTAWKMKEEIVKLKKQTISLHNLITVQNNVIKKQHDSIETAKMKLKYYVYIDTSGDNNIYIDAECKPDTVKINVPYPVITIRSDTIKTNAVIQQPVIDTKSRDNWRSIAFVLFLCNILQIILIYFIFKLKKPLI